ncbi:MAG: hypothetical protein Q9203_002207 [Teloschistes exilis]
MRDFLKDEYDRAVKLCDWLHVCGLGGLGWRYEETVRMSAGVEVVWCNATDCYGSSGNGPGLGETRVRPATYAFLNYCALEFTNRAESRRPKERKRLNLTVEGSWEGGVNDAWRSKALESLTRRRRLHGLDGVTVSDAARMQALWRLICVSADYIAHSNSIWWL